MSEVALITGSGQGIGRSIALRLAKDGFDIGLNDLQSNQSAVEGVAKEIEALGRKTTIFYGDVSDDASVKSMVATVAETLGSLNVMVANAGISQIGPITETSVESWDRTFAINVRGVFLCYKYAAEYMIKQGKGGRIIGASSIYGKRGFRGSAPYAASKFAVRGLTQSAADEWGRFGITVNAYAPGIIDTPMTQSIETPDLKKGDFLEMGKQFSVLGRNGTPEDVAGLVSYIASKDSSFVTGQSLSVNGGFFFD
jgi:acetoin reductase-like protein